MKVLLKAVQNIYSSSLTKKIGIISHVKEKAFYMQVKELQRCSKPVRVVISVACQTKPNFNELILNRKEEGN